MAIRLLTFVASKEPKSKRKKEKEKNSLNTRDEGTSEREGATMSKAVEK